MISEGTYHEERRRLHAEVKIIHEESQKSSLEWLGRDPHRFDETLLDEFDNFSRGLRSPDLEIRQIFQDAFDHFEMGKKSLVACRVIMRVARRVEEPKQRGRPPALPPWRNEVDALDAMRLHILNGTSIPRAAKMVADAEERANATSRADRFEKLYRDRMRLRDLKCE